MITFWLTTILSFLIIVLFFVLKQKIEDFNKGRGVYISKKKYDVSKPPKETQIYTINRNYLYGKPLPTRKKRKY